MAPDRPSRHATDPARPGGGRDPLRRLAPSFVLSLAILALGPAGSVVSRWAREVPGRMVVLLGAVFALAVLAFLGWAFRRLRGLPRGELLRRAGWVLAALALVAVQQLTNERGTVVERTVERMHVLLFGALAVAVFVAARRRPPTGEATGGVAAAVAALITVAWISVIDELIQDALMARAGDLDDVVLNLFSGAVGLLAALGLFPTGGRGPGVSVPALLLAAAPLPLATALFLDRAHLGSRIELEGLGAFHSFHTREGLERANLERARRWSRRLPPQPPFAWWVLQDDFLVEGGWHVQARNRALSEGDLETVWIENTILERFYSAMLEASFPEEVHPYRLKPWDLDRLRAAGAGETRPATGRDGLISAADRGRIWVRPTRPRAYAVAAALTAGLLIAAWGVRRAGPRPSEGARALAG